MNKKLFILATLAILSVFAGCKKTVLDEPKAAVPELTSIQPTSGIAGILATITGKNFSTTASANEVYFGEAKAQVTAATATSLSVLVPENAAGQCAVSVKVGDKTATGLNFTYIEVQVEARVAGISPVEGTAGIDVTVNGEGFGTSAAAIKVMFGDAEAQVKSVADNAITVVAPDMAGTAQTVTVAVYKDEDIVPTPKAFTYKFDNELALGAIAGTIYASGNIDTEEPDAIEVPLTLKKNGETSTATEEDLEGVYLVPAKEGAQEVQIEQILVEDGVLKAYAPAGTKGDYSLKVVAKSAIPVVSEAKFCVYYVPKYDFDVTHWGGTLGASSNVDGTGADAKFHSAYAIAASPDGKYLYVTTNAQNTNSVRKVQIESAGAIVTTVASNTDLGAGFYPYGGDFVSNGDYYACSKPKTQLAKIASNGTFSTIDLTLPTSDYAPEGKSYNGMSVLGDGNKVYIADRDFARILTFDTATNQITGQIVLVDKNDNDNHIQIQVMAWGKNKETFIVGGYSDYSLYEVNKTSGDAKRIAGYLKDGELGQIITDYKTNCAPLEATVGQCTGIYYNEEDDYIYFINGPKSGNTVYSAMRVLVPGLGGDYSKGKVLDISLKGSGSSLSGYLNAVGGMTKVGNTFYIIANSAVMRVTPKAAN